jgi:hypothetical protein
MTPAESASVRAGVGLTAGRAACLMLSGLVFGQAPGHPTAGFPIPCSAEVAPVYPAPGRPPLVKFWNEAALGHDWRPPACTGWSTPGFATMVTTAARFGYAGGWEGLLRRAGAASELAGLRYWSTTHQKWQTLIVKANAVTAPPPSHPRPDFLTGEMRAGQSLYLEQTDNLSGTATYRLHVAEASPDRIVFDIENVTAMRYLFLPLFHPGEMQSIYFLDREPDDTWRYYAITRTGRKSSRLTAGHEASSINRAVAFYRFIAGIPADQEPPAVR